MNDCHLPKDPTCSSWSQPHPSLEMSWLLAAKEASLKNIQQFSLFHFEVYMHGIIQYVVSSTGFLCSAVCFKNAFMLFHVTIVHFYSSLASHCIPPFIPSDVDGHLRCFQFSVITKHAAINFLLMFPGICGTNSIGYSLRNATAESQGMKYRHLL